MFVGIFLAIAIYYYVRIAKLKCHISSLNIIVTIILYISYAILFARFFIQRYMSDKSVKNIEKKTDANSKLKATWNTYSNFLNIFFIYWFIFVNVYSWHIFLEFAKTYLLNNF